MAISPVVLFRGAATTTTTTVLATVPASTTYVVTNIAIANTAASSATATISLDSVVIVPTSTIAANSVAFFDLKQPLATTKTITGGASATTVNFHISGISQA